MLKPISFTMNPDIKMIAMGCKPDPYKFTIVKIEHIEGNTIIEAKYDGCISFDGHKLMLLQGKWLIEDFDSLDPHFLNEEYAVVGRFIPTSLGWNLARACAVRINLG